MFPQIKLALLFASIAKNHGHKILHANNPDLLTRDLGDALKKQKQVLSDPNKNTLLTAYDVLPLIVEVKILTVVTANKLGVATKNKSDIQILEEIIVAADARRTANPAQSADYAKDIKGTLEWTRRLFSHPEIQDVLAMEVTTIEFPKSPRDALKFGSQLVGRFQDELTRISEFLRTAKNLHDLTPPPVEKKKPTPRKKPGPGAA